MYENDSPSEVEVQARNLYEIEITIANVSCDPDPLT
jgi:hypothetical protein